MKIYKNRYHEFSVTKPERVQPMSLYDVMEKIEKTPNIVDIEVYYPRWGNRSCRSGKPFHSSQIDNDNTYDGVEIDGAARVLEYEIMSEEEYTFSVLAVGEFYADFDDQYDNKDGKIAVILIERPEDTDEE